MKYYAPFGSSDPNASYVDRNTPGAVRGSAVPGKAVEATQRELVNFLLASGLTPTEEDLDQVATAARSQAMNYRVAGGTANALTATLDPAPASLAALVGVPLRLVTVANTSGTVTLSVNGLAATTVYRRNSNSLLPGDIRAGITELMFDGTYFRVLSVPFGASLISGNGWIDLHGGLTLQWGNGNTASGTATITFPKAFSASPYSVVGIDGGALSWTTTNATFLGVSTRTSTTCIFRSVNWTGSAMVLDVAGFFWMAIGPT
ncbi:gp53-like domain-containing protein [Ancylobacter sp. SL191]|uniref:gp53-like domain-containing protein n=1 Tax=Ancylobacter sp. SL191 TaxID=2995166 RepID=UPI00226E0D41|nr:hypothetical protein [Ancylobacter sp. SL191]WAC26441.1 hypothetical protein OU996_15650 [Ancylobacter sp. SL191]